MKSILTITLIMIFATIYSQDTITDPFEIPAEFPGGENAMFCFIETQLNYSKLTHLETAGRLFITFVVDSDGKLKNIEINPDQFHRAGDLITDSIITAEFARIIKLMPDWTPARLSGTSIKSLFFLPFRLPYTDFKCLDFKTDEDIVTDPDTLPYFPFGEGKTNNERVSEYINMNLKWPNTGADCLGRVHIKAVIEKSGELTSAIVIRPLCPGFDEEALRVVNNMPDWTPGIKSGEPVRTVTIIPIIFVLH